jgi:hypothetical protein
MEDQVMNGPVKALLLILGVVAIFSTSTSAQSCNPAVVDYIVRNEKGTILTDAELKVLAEKLPKAIGDANTDVSEVSFAADGQTYYWPESVESQTGKKVPALEFANAATCTMHLGQVDLSYQGKEMHLIFDLDIARAQADRRPVVDSLPFQAGTFRLDLAEWSHDKDKLIPAKYWKKTTADH